MNVRVIRFLRQLSLMAALAVVGAPGAQAGYVIEFSQQGLVAPSDPATCPNPFAGCSLTAVGTVQASSGGFGPWNAVSVFHLVVPPTAPTFSTEGTFYWDDPSPANDDLFGITLGTFDPDKFTNQSTYIVTGGSGRFAGLGGVGQSLIQISQGAAPPFEYVEQGRLHVAEPATAALALLAIGMGASLRRRPRC